ncbi:hypothetical protein OGCDGJMD_00509 [Cyanobium usitatum str. Tous]|nr:hypothetical protein OGCDGJMD_00509 [Cyanobium usitatum str. Tous]
MPWIQFVVCQTVLLWVFRLAPDTTADRCTALGNGREPHRKLIFVTR